MAEVLRAEGLSKHFGGLVAVNQVGFQIQPNESVGIIGPNGSGKTTLFNLLTGFFPPTRGRIHFFGKDITDLAPNQRVLQGMVRTFQLVSVFNSMTVWENLVLSSLRFHRESLSEWGFLFAPANQESIRQSCFEAMKGVGLEKNWRTMTSELSYGSKRMLEMAIALSLKPKLLLLDEPLSGLSDLEIVEVLQILHQIKKDLTLIIIEHKLSKIVNLVDRLCVMNEGSFICEGEPDRVLNDQKVRECYWGKGELSLEG
jgi:branched-chain amino acid transport system ATP-binding protein